MDLDLLLARLEAGSGAPLRDFFDSIPVSKSIEPSRRRLEAVGIAILEKNTALKPKVQKKEDRNRRVLFSKWGAYLSSYRVI